MTRKKKSPSERETSAWTDDESSDDEQMYRRETSVKALIHHNREIEEWMGRRITFYAADDLSSGHGHGNRHILMPGEEGFGEKTTVAGEGTRKKRPAGAGGAEEQGEEGRGGK